MRVQACITGFSFPGGVLVWFQGWIKGINSNTLMPSRDAGQDGNITAANTNKYVARDIYAFSLAYFDNDYNAIGTSGFITEIAGSDMYNEVKQLYNGNINHMITSLPFDSFGIQATVYAYDQLNRLASMKTFRNIDTASNSWMNNSQHQGGWETKYTYDANGNILSLYRQGDPSQSLEMDSLTYTYYSNTNRLRQVNDAVCSTYYSIDIDDQTDINNYVYDNIGNLIQDKAEGINSILWTVSGKVSEVSKSDMRLRFEYDPMGNRIRKDLNDTLFTNYVRDPQGNVMAVYEEYRKTFMPDSINEQNEKNILAEYLYSENSSNFVSNVIKPCLMDTAKLNMIDGLLQSNISAAIDSIEANVYSLKEFGILMNNYIRDNNIDLSQSNLSLETVNINYSVREHHIYGSSRLGMQRTDSIQYQYEADHYYNVWSQSWHCSQYSSVSLAENQSPYLQLERKRGLRFYELSNHLGNVLVTISDRKIPVADTNQAIDTVLYFTADVLSATDYYPFGMQMAGRSFIGVNYKYGFNSQEKDDDIYGTGNSYTAEYWQYDARLGRRWNLDPKPNPSINSYACFINNPVFYSDPFGDTVKYDKGNGLLWNLKARVFNMVASTLSKTYGGNYKYLKEDDMVHTIKRNRNPIQRHSQYGPFIRSEGKDEHGIWKDKFSPKTPWDFETKEEYQEYLKLEPPKFDPNAGSDGNRTNTVIYFDLRRKTHKHVNRLFEKHNARTNLIVMHGHDIYHAVDMSNGNYCRKLVAPDRSLSIFADYDAMGAERSVISELNRIRIFKKLKPREYYWLDEL